MARHRSISRVMRARRAAARRRSPPARAATAGCSSSGSGKTTLAAALGARLGLPVIELDALVHQANWVEISDAELRERITPILASDGWVIDGAYRRKLGDVVLEAADTVVWLDLPIHIWFPRLVRRSWRRWSRREVLWNGNRETLRAVVWGRDSLLGYALRMHFRNRRELPRALARFDVTRLRTTDEVAAFVDHACDSVAR
jgi:adenylate kinase family enzyme